MPTLHIISSNSDGQHVFKGMFGSITPHPSDSASVIFKVAAPIAAASTSLSALSVGSGFKLKRTEVTTIEGSEGAIDAIKANLAQGLRHKWEQGYQTIAQRFLPDAAPRAQPNHDVVVNESLVAIPGLGSVNRSLLAQSLEVEREIAERGIDNLLRGIPNVAPHWVQIKSQQMWIGQNVDETDVVMGEPKINNIDEFAAPIPMQSWSPEQPPFAPMTPGQAEGWFDINRAIPLYLPVQRRSVVEKIVRAAGFGRNDDGSITPEQKTLNEEVLGIIQTTGVLRTMLIDNAQFAAVDAQSRVEVQGPMTDYYEEDDEDQDENHGDDDGDASLNNPRRDTPRG